MAETNHTVTEDIDISEVFPGINDTNRSDEKAYTYDERIRALIADASDYSDSDLSPPREDNVRHYYGFAPGLDEDEDDAEEPYSSSDGSVTNDNGNRSRVVSTDVRDTVLSVLPSLIRIFANDENIVEFVPNSPETDEMAKQAKDDTLYTFWEDNNGFMLLHNVFKDVLTEKVGVVRWYTVDNKEVSVKEYHNITQEEVMAVLQEVSETGVSPTIEDIGELNEVTGTFNKVRIKYAKSRPEHVVESIPPSDLRIDRRATSVNNARIIGYSSIVPVSDVVKLGVSKEKVRSHAGRFIYTRPERSLHNPGIDTSTIDNDMVEYGEYFVRIDSDDDGIDELHLIQVIGSDYEILSDNIVDDVQMAVFCGDPRPHTVVGDCLADLVKDIQGIKTRLLRGALDSLSSSLFPDTYVQENQVNMDDILSDGVARVIRVRGNPNDAVREFRSTFVGSDAFNMMAQLDAVRQSRTGISEASKGVDPKALQSTNVMGVDAIVTGAQERIELIARIIAETGFKDMMRGLLREICKSPNRRRTMKMRGNWVEYDQSTYDPNLTVRVNPVLGRGSDVVRMQALQQVQSTQLMIMQNMGINNPFVTPQQFLNGVEDTLALVNVKNINRYFNAITPEIMQMVNGPKPPTPEEKIAQAELEKVKASVAGEMARIKQQDKKLMLDEDFRRDKLGLDVLAKLVQNLSLPDSEGVVDARNIPPGA